MKGPLSAAGNALAVSVLLLVGGCSTPPPTASRPLPPRVLAQLSSRAGPPESLGYRREFVADRTVWLPPQAGYHLRRPHSHCILPLDLRSGAPVVTARLNGRADVQLLVDTGAPSPLLSGRAGAAGQIRTLDTNRFPAQRIRGVTGSELSGFGVVDQLELGPLVVTNLATRVRLEESTQRSASGADSLLGLRPIIAGSSYVTLDYPRRQMIVSPVEHFVPPATAASDLRPLPFIITNDTLRAQVAFPNGHHAEFVIDTGAAVDFALTSATLQDAGLRDAVRRGRPQTIRGIGGDLTEIRFTIDTIELGSARYTATRAITASWSRQNLIGSGWLRQFRVTFDFRRQMLWLEPPGGADGALSR